MCAKRLQFKTITAKSKFQTQEKELLTECTSTQDQHVNDLLVCWMTFLVFWMKVVQKYTGWKCWHFCALRWSNILWHHALTSGGQFFLDNTGFGMKNQCGSNWSVFIQLIVSEYNFSYPHTFFLCTFKWKVIFAEDKIRMKKPRVENFSPI